MSQNYMAKLLGVFLSKVFMKCFIWLIFLFYNMLVVVVAASVVTSGGGGGCGGGRRGSW